MRALYTKIKRLRNKLNFSNISSGHLQNIEILIITLKNALQTEWQLESIVVRISGTPLENDIRPAQTKLPTLKNVKKFWKYVPTPTTGVC